MINLLPPEEKRELLREKNKKLVIVLGDIVLIAMVCLVLVLFALKFYILVEVDSGKLLLNNAEKKYQTPALLALKKVVQKYNSILVKVDDFYKKEMHFSDALKIILDIPRPEGIVFTQVTLSRGGDKIKATASGISDSRDHLLLFKDSIEGNKKIENAYFPPENWIKPLNINFNLTFEIILQNEKTK